MTWSRAGAASLPGAVLAIVRAVALAAGALVVGSCGHDPASIPATDARALFQAMCATCHGAAGRPPAAMAARLGVRDLTASEFRARVNVAGPALVEQQVRNGSRSKLMPSFAGVLDDAQIKALAAFVATELVAAPAAPGPPAAPR